MKRMLTLVLIVALAVVASKLVLEDLAGLSIETAAERWLANAGARSALLIVTLLASDVVLPVPSSLVMVLSGAAFGLVWGSLFAFAGSVAGQWLGFEIARRYGQGVARRLIRDEDIADFQGLFETHGFAAVLITRPLPIIMETISVVAGLACMRRSLFLPASFAGTMPAVIVYAYAGAYSRESGSVLPAVLVMGVVMAVGALFYRAARATRASSSYEASPGSHQAARRP
jgi:uncharacterized membrane protein YdjX (TVP38/TMEM64 family)